MTRSNLLAPRFVAALCLALGCATPSPGGPAMPRPEPARADTPVASRPAPAHGAPRLRTECLDPYGPCPFASGFPAMSADGMLVALPDSGPPTERDEIILTVRIVEIDSGDELESAPIVTQDDHDRGTDPATGLLTRAALAEIEARARALQSRLERGGFQPLMALGTVHEQKPGAEVDGLRAMFDGTRLVITDASGAVRWQRAIGPSATDASGHGHACGPFPVADVAVWVSREPSVVVAQVSYIGSHDCAAESPFLVWR